MPILESALGIENAFAIATASDRVVALTIGLEDYTADLGVAKTPGGAESLYARMRVVNAAHAAHVQAIDSVFGDVGDIDGLLRWGEASRAMGFEGMGCIHPIQIEIIHRAFAPTAAELDKALKIVAAYEDAQARGLGVVSLGSKMIDAPVVQRALKLVARARQMGLLREDSRGGRRTMHERRRCHRSDYERRRPPRADHGQRREASRLSRRRRHTGPPDARLGRRSAATAIIPPTATSACPISRPRCGSAGCATA